MGLDSVTASEWWCPHKLGQDWGDICFLVIQNCPCRAPSPLLSVFVLVGFEEAQDQALPWVLRGFARQAVGRMEGGFPLLAAPCRQSTSCCCTLRGHQNSWGRRWR